jgi:hypothetical protein
MPQHTSLVAEQSESTAQNLIASAAGAQYCCVVSSETRVHSCPWAVSHTELSEHFFGHAIALWQMLPAPP